MISEALKKIISKEHLTRDEAYQVMMQIMSGDALPTQIAGYLIALRMKGETTEELVGSVMAMREHASFIQLPNVQFVADTCGTGGDHSGSFNISTASAIVAAAAGVTIAKHGNRSVSSQSGSADVLSSLGVNINLTATQMEQCLRDIGLAFLFAPTLHPAMKYAAAPRKEMGVRTIFNLLGPMSNPAKVKRQVVGVFTPELTKVFSSVLSELGSEHVLAVHGADGSDEFSITGETLVTELLNGKISSYNFHPNSVGLSLGKREDLLGGSPEKNADIIANILQGKITNSAKQVVILNAGAAIYVSGMTPNLNSGIQIANEQILSGAAWNKLQQLVHWTNHL